MDKELFILMHLFENDNKAAKAESIHYYLSSQKIYKNKCV